MTAIALPRTPAAARRARAEAAQLGVWTRRIIIAWHATTPEQRAAGVEWYDRALMEAAAIDPDNPARAAGVIAALSPQTGWDKNLDDARSLIHALDNQLDVPRVNTEPMRSQAVRIALGADPWSVLNGPKVRSFLANILGNPNVVTVDRWAVRIATGRDLKNAPKGRQYERLARAYVRAADKLGEDPRTVQAATWVAAREAANNSG